MRTWQPRCRERRTGSRIGDAFSGLQPVHEHNVNFVHCKAIFDAMPHTRRERSTVRTNPRFAPAGGLYACRRLAFGFSRTFRRQFFGLAASIAARLTIWPISLACSASERICA
jgi:hypothetical protein